METIRNQVINQCIADRYPNAQLVHWDEPGSGLTFYTETQLAQLRQDWFPLYCRRDPEKGLVYGGRSGVVHTYTEGETGCGKTTRFAMQSIRALSCLPSKPSFLIVDLFGEIIENMYDHLMDMGYQIKILNCDDPSRSDTFNPLASITQQCQRDGQLNNTSYNHIRHICEVMMPVQSERDPIWEIGARSYVNGLILDKFEDLMEGKVAPGTITLYNIIQNHYWLRNELTHSKLLSLDHFAQKGSSAMSVQKLLAVTDNAEKTKASYFGVVENYLDRFGQPAMYQLSSCSTIQVDDFIDQPTAIIIQSGNTEVGNNMVAFLVNELFNTVELRGRTSPTKMLPRQIHCFLDEFANCHIADADRLVRMLTTSRKYGMHWHLILQCDSQLEMKYNPYVGDIIRANCAEIFMGSNNYQTVSRFSRSCGQQTAEAPWSRALQQTPQLLTTDLVPADRLDRMPLGTAYIKAAKNKVLFTFMEAFFNCPEYTRPENILDVYPVNAFDYRLTRSVPDEEDDDEEIEWDEDELWDADSFLKPAKSRDSKETSVPPDSLIMTSDLFQMEVAAQADAAVLEQLTCLPEIILKPLRKVMLHHGQDFRLTDHIPRRLLKFEFLETFIGKNNFPTKKAWTENLSKEYQCLRDTGYFSPAVVDSLYIALSELDVDLTLSNILEIKRIINGNN